MERMTVRKLRARVLLSVLLQAVRVGLLTGLGLMAIPGVGPVVAAGWLVATLAGAAAGGVTGGAVGALTEAGISKDEADVYAEGLRRGGAVVSRSCCRYRRRSPSGNNG